MTISTCWKWVALDEDPRWAGVSPADRAALELALRFAEATADTVTVVTVGPAGAEGALREALAAGAARAVRIDAPAGLTSDAVAAALVPVVAGSSWVLCGDYSPDRGSGSVPAFLAGELGVAQALGLVDVALDGDGVRALRRLDGGRREELAVARPGVLSVEGSVATLRRASLAAELAARTAHVEVVHGPTGPCDAPIEVGPYRPRARVLPPPIGDDALSRVRALTDAGAVESHGERVELDPATAARRILDTLREWRYLDLSAPHPAGAHPGQTGEGSELGEEEDVAGGGG